MPLLLFFLWLTGLGWAHGIDDALLVLKQDQQHWVGTWRTPLKLWEGCDQDHDGSLSRTEISNHWQRLTQKGILLQGLPPVLSDGAILQGPAQLTVPVEFPVAPQSQVELEYHLFLPRVANQQCLAVFTSNLGSSSTLLLTEQSPRQSLDLTPASLPAAGHQEERPSTLAGFFHLGVKHILTGWDHLLFLFTLVIVGGSLWRWLQVITAFSISHSLSLALAVFGIVHLSPEIIEPIIALSITVSAVFSFRGVPTQTLHGGWIVAFAFGLIHGLGFAGVLAEMQLSGPQAMVPLVGFNLGVEAGQLLVAIALLPVIRLLSQGKTGTRIRQLLTALAGLMGLYWFAFGTPA
jgi:hypothetical protein